MRRRMDLIVRSSRAAPRVAIAASIDREELPFQDEILGRLPLFEGRCAAFVAREEPILFLRAVGCAATAAGKVGDSHQSGVGFGSSESVPLRSTFSSILKMG